MRFDVAAYKVALKKAQELLEGQDGAGDIGFTDPNGNIAGATVGAALVELGLSVAGAVADIEGNHLIVPTGERPATEEDLYKGLQIFDSTESKPYWCTTPGEKEVDTLEVLNDVIVTGSVDVTLNGVTVNTQLAGDVPAFYSLTIDTAPTSAGDVVVTLAGVDTTIAVLAEDPAALVADKIRLAFAGNIDWITLGEGETIGITAGSPGPSPSGAYSFSGGTTGAASTLGVVLLAPGVLADTIPQIATKIRDNTYEGWTTSGEGEFVIFTKNSIGACSAPAYTDVDTGVAASFVRTNQGVTTVWATLPVFTPPELEYIGVNESNDEFLCDLQQQREAKVSMLMTNAGAKTVAFTEWPISGRCEVFLEITTLAAPTVTWNFSGTVRWAGGSAPAIEAGKVYRISTYTNDGGTTWDAYLLGIITVS